MGRGPETLGHFPAAVPAVPSTSLPSKAPQRENFIKSELILIVSSFSNSIVQGRYCVGGNQEPDVFTGVFDKVSVHPDGTHLAQNMQQNGGAPRVEVLSN